LQLAGGGPFDFAQGRSAATYAFGVGDPPEAAGGDASDAERDLVAVAEFYSTVFEQLHECAVDIAEAEEAEVVCSDGAGLELQGFKVSMFQGVTEVTAQ
jgi:hypothetical protein